MSLAVEYEEIVEALRAVGLQAGDLVLVHTRLFTVGLIKGAEPLEIPGIYLRAFQEVLGERGTLVVPTFTMSFGRLGKPFMLETSPSEMGVFSECVRRVPGSRRSLHPIQSLTALGAEAEQITADHPRWNVGYDTTWDRMVRRGGAKVVNVGISLRHSLSLAHHFEYLACVPYVYHKILRGDVFAGSVQLAHDFLLSARFLRYGIQYDLGRVEEDFSTLSASRRVPLGEDWVEMVPMGAAFEVCMNGLKADPYYLLKQPPSFVEGEIPCDGRTSGREGAVPSFFQVAR